MLILMIKNTDNVTEICSEVGFRTGPKDNQQQLAVK